MAERTCQNCGDPIPPSGGPGRPRVYCSTGCRRSWNYGRRRERVEAERRAAWERARYRLDVRHFGKREADRRARRLAERRSDA